jgi:hypothetical protein
MWASKLGEDVGWIDFIIGLRLAEKRTKGGPRRSSCLRWCSEVTKAWSEGWRLRLRPNNMPSSSNVPQDDEKDERHANEDTFVSHEQSRVQAEDVDAPGSSSQVVDRRNSSLLQAHPQNQIIWSPSQGVITRSHKHASFIEHHFFVSCVEPTCIDEALQDPDWVNAMHEELNNFTHNQVWILEKPPQDARII